MDSKNTPKYMLQRMEKAMLKLEDRETKNVWVDVAGPFSDNAKALKFVRDTSVVGTLRVVRIVQGVFDSKVKETRTVMEFNDVGDPETVADEQ